MDTVLLTPREVAAVLRISKAHSYKMIKDGEIPSIRFGRTVRVKQEALDAFILKNTSETDSTQSILPDPEVHSIEAPKEEAMT